MMLNGFYTVHFKTQLGEGAGVVQATGADIVGGDSSFLYYGTQQEAGHGFRAHVRAKKHFDAPGMFSVFGKDDFSIVLEAATMGDLVACKGTSPDAPGITFTAVLQKVAR
jgi:hypothetical protein